MPLRRKLALLLAATAIAWWLSGLAVVLLLTRRGSRATHEVPPAARPAIEEHVLQTVDGEQLGAWWFEGERDRAVVVLLHANGGSRTASFGRLRELARSGYGVLAPTLRAHGDSTGSLNDFGYGARLDAVAAVAFVEQRTSARPIVLFGTSLGAAAAVYASSELGSRVDAFVLESPYESLAIAARNRVRRFLPRPLSDLAYGALRAAAFVRVDVPTLSPVRATDSIRAHAIPTLVLAGERDWHATPDEARAIAHEIGPSAECIVIPNAAHDRLITTAPEQYWGAVQALLTRAEARAAR